ncbi:DUF6478 family protein [Pseudaestuariivita rosea]|uniref:DUF6478 family protein n=1 Tax=Pseudaestuariivita rosea TaxID=2763263 RepID=UPI001ABBC272|nr:DUF6478 family protein [Pseudaestuariivita rosea]
MAKTVTQNLLHRWARKHWARIAANAADADLASLRYHRARARELRAQINEVLHIADGRLAASTMTTVPALAAQNSDWIWRPELWRGPIPGVDQVGVVSGTNLGDHLHLYHDCKAPEIITRQLRNHDGQGHAPFGLRLDIFQMTGDYLSLVVQLPKVLADQFNKDNIIRLDLSGKYERTLPVLLRLNIRHGPNTEQVSQYYDASSATVSAEFDVSHLKINHHRVEAMWVDIIFTDPSLNEITIYDLVFTRHPRAEL